jgi:hypothetical protein
MGDERVTYADGGRAAPRSHGIWPHRRLLWASIAALAWLGLVLVSPTPAAYANSFEVTSDGDGPDASIDGTCDADPGPDVVCTLRAAIEEANNAADSDIITFAIPAGAVHTRADGVRVIYVGGGAPCGCDLPTIVNPVTIDGRSQGTGSNNAPTVLILPDPTTPPPASNGLWVDNTSATITGLAIGQFADGIFLTDGTGTSIKGSYLGIDPDGSTAITNGVGIEIFDADGFDIGGPAATDGNLISGNASYGIEIDQSFLCGCGAALSRVRNNRIGLRADGATRLDNGDGGISVFDGDTIIIGGAGQGNVISGNGADGIAIVDGFGADVEISGNLIGTDVTGAVAVPNLGNGISLVPTGPINPGPFNTTIGSGAVGGGNVIAGNGGYGILVLNAFGTRIKGNLIGLASDGSTARPNSEGVVVSFSAITTIGGAAETDRNVISGNAGPGIDVLGDFSFGLSDSTTILGNFVGVATDGKTARPNLYGIYVDTAFDTDIGGAAPGERNVISGNTKDGIYFTGTCGCPGAGSDVRGNYIGLASDGSTVVANGENGIQLFRAAGVEIGDIPLGSGNVISGNTLSGILMVDPDTDEIDVLGNRIGTDATGMLARGNGLDGVTAVPADPSAPGSLGPFEPFIGSDAIGSGNLISGNTRHGIYMLRVIGFEMEIGRNLIGVQANGGGVLPNGGDGILLDDSSPTAVFENVVANNGGGGVVMAFNLASQESPITANSIYDNGGPGIDITPSVNASGVGDGPTANVPNGSTNFPVLASATTSAVGTVVTGTLNADADTAYRVELFASPSCDPSGFGEGRAYLGVVDVFTDSGGDAAFATTAGQIPAGQYITATASNEFSTQTSEFSRCLAVTAAAVLVTPTTGLVTTEAGGTATFTVALSTLPSADVTVGLTSNKPGEATVSPASLTFTSADGTTPQTVTVTGVADAVADGNQPFTIVTAPASSLDPSYAGIDPPDVAGQNQDAPTLPTLSIHAATVTEGTGVTTPMSFSVTLAPASTQPVTVNWQVVDGTAQATSDLAGGPMSGSLTFSPGETSKPIALLVVGDNIPEQNETFTVRLSGANAVIGTDTATGTIDNDDGTPGPCAPRPNITLTSRKSGTDQIVVTVTAGSGNIKTIAFGSAQKPIQNAIVETVNPSAIIQTYGVFTAPAGVTQQAFIVRRITPNQPVMVSLVIEDGCGAWTTFVGSGPTGF